MNNKESRHLVVLDSTKRKGILLDILEFCEKIVKESRRLSVEKNGLLNAIVWIERILERAGSVCRD